MDYGLPFIVNDNAALLHRKLACWPAKARKASVDPAGDSGWYASGIPVEYPFIG
jgi:hypothetical protein